MTFLRAYSYLAAPSVVLVLGIGSLLGWAVGTYTVILMVLVFCTIPAALAVWIGEKAGSLAAVVYKGNRRPDLKEQFSSDLARARYMKIRGMHREALDAMNEYLNHVPEDPEGLFLKAQILSAAGDDPAETLQCLRSVLERTSPDETYHRWARSLMYDLSRDDAGGAVQRKQDPAAD